MDEFGFKITKHIGTLEKTGSGWTKELNLVSWNGKEPKYDIRDWSEDHDRMSRGITLTENQMRVLVELLKTMEVWNNEEEL